MTCLKALHLKFSTIDVAPRGATRTFYLQNEPTPINGLRLDPGTLHITHANLYHFVEVLVLIFLSTQMFNEPYTDRVISHCVTGRDDVFFAARLASGLDSTCTQEPRVAQPGRADKGFRPQNSMLLIDQYLIQM